MGTHLAAILAGLALTGAGVSAQNVRLGPSAQNFIKRAIAASRPFLSRSAAIRAGYRRLGPDFPGMGEHWIQPALVVRGEVDPTRPSVLCYLEIDGEPVLVGLAFTAPLGPGDQPPAEPFGRGVWHDHKGSVDEESLILNHPASIHDGGSGYRLSMVHVWTDAENPDGVLAQNNWTLPYLRAGLKPPARPDPESARGLSLAHEGKDFYAELISRAVDLSPEEGIEIRRALDGASRKADEAIAALKSGRPSLDTADPFPGIWREFWAEVRGSVRVEVWPKLSALSRASHTEGRHRIPPPLD